MLTKKIISVLLSIIMIATVIPVAYAYDGKVESIFSKQEKNTVEVSVKEDDVTEISVEVSDETQKESKDTYDETPVETESETDVVVYSSKKEETEIVALLSVVTRVEAIGHAWIYIENVSNRTLQVGHYSLYPNEGVSVGLFSFTCDDGIGIYYNVEAYCCNVHGGDGLVSITTDLDAEEMSKLSRNIKNYLNHWDPFFNCMYFAFSLWNSVSGRKLVPLVIPALGQLQLRMHGGKENNLKMYCPTPDQVYRLKGRGSKAKLVPVSPESIDQPIGG